MARDPYQQFRKAARERCGRSSAFRVGIEVGRAGEDLPPPPAYTEKHAECYNAGLVVGRQYREHAIEIERMESARRRIAQSD